MRNHIKTSVFLLLFCWLATAPAWAFTFVAGSAIDASSDGASITTPTCATPTGTANNDMLFAVLKYPNTTTVSGIPTGWTLRGQRNDTGAGAFYELYSKLAASEGATQQWTLVAAGRAGVTCYAFRSDFNTSNPIDSISNTAYTTVDSTVRAASISATAANSPVVFFSLGHASTLVVTTPPTSPSAFAEDADQFSADSRYWREAAHMTWASSGATGAMDGALTDGTNPVTTGTKHAFAVILNPATAAAPNFFYRRVIP